MTRNKIPKSVKKIVLERHGGKCVNCGATEELEIHHVVPLEIGGNDIQENMVPLCYYCHKAVTNHELLLKTAGRKHITGGRKRKIPDNYKEILDGYIHCQYGTKRCLELLGLSENSYLTDNVWYKEYIKDQGIKSCRNNIDIKLAKGNIKRGMPVGKIVYLQDGKEEICYARQAIDSPRVEQMEFGF